MQYGYYTTRLVKNGEGGRIFKNSFEASLQSGNIVANRHNNCNMVYVMYICNNTSRLN